MQSKRYKVTNADIIKWLGDQPDEPRYHAALGDTPYALMSIAKRFGKSNAKPAKWAAAAERWGDNGENNPYNRTSKGFMGQTWDGFESLAAYQSWVTTWGYGLLKVLYPGAIVAFFGGSRTAHRVGVGLEDAGFEVFDTISWLYGSGWPKGKSIEQEAVKLLAVTRAGGGGRLAEDVLADAVWRWKGYNTALKPAYEPIILARAPRKGRVIDNALQGGAGALNIDGARIPVIGGDYKAAFERVSIKANRTESVYDRSSRPPVESKSNDLGRYPANVVLTHSEQCRFLGYSQTDGGQDEDAENLTLEPGGLETVESWQCAPDCPVGQLNAQSGVSTSQGGAERTASRHIDFSFGAMPREIRGDTGGASRFFYTGKAATWERCAGLPARSKHPTMKPIQLTEWLARLLLPPPLIGQERRLLIPFSGVGSEMIGAMLAGWDMIEGIELGESYVQDCILRLQWWERFRTYDKAKRQYNKINKVQPNQRSKPDEPGESETQLTLF